MPCSASSKVAPLHFSASPTNSGTIACCRHHRQAGGIEHGLNAGGAILMAVGSHCEVFRCLIAAVAAAQIAGGSAVVKMKAGRVRAHRVDQVLAAVIKPPRQPNALASVPRARRRDASRLAFADAAPRGPYMPTACTSST